MTRKIPEFVNCTKCGRRLDTRTYMAWPDEDIPEERVTWVFQPTYPYFSVHCANCGQYSVFSPFEKDSPFEKEKSRDELPL